MPEISFLDRHTRHKECNAINVPLSFSTKQWRIVTCLITTAHGFENELRRAGCNNVTKDMYNYIREGSLNAKHTK